jgi:hypothetical protein
MAECKCVTSCAEDVANIKHPGFHYVGIVCVIYSLRWFYPLPGWYLSMLAGMVRGFSNLSWKLIIRDMKAEDRVLWKLRIVK